MICFKPLEMNPKKNIRLIKNNPELRPLHLALVSLIKNYFDKTKYMGLARKHLRSNN
jgi:hypothetical protein